ncbi:hypothetical protein GJ744_010440 [Endocarpon pusillum]|uniref:Post-SET domain-containing protein n=1 Tax=Endocarpon pusillum TaxID=364733 RepID=A0A8H7AG83_9EURO|nr:hypothetical protein GJ744_010440 [Endocarpon pusillum]
MIVTPSWQQPSHPDLIQVISSPDKFGNFALSLVSLPAGAFFARIDKYHFVNDRSYATVEASQGRHLELDSDLLYVNHSCDPALEFDVTRMEVRVSHHRRLNKGDELTFFYPSTELHMAQPFDCHCRASECKGRIAGAAQMEPSHLDEYWLNQHVQEQLARKNYANDVIVATER